MGATLTKLVFRPPKPTPIKGDRFFYIDVPEKNPFTCVPDMGCSMVPHELKGGCASDIHAENGPHRIPAFFLLRRGAKLTLLYSHGNAEDLGMMYRRMKDLARVLCVNIMAYDYSGYGLSQPECKPSEDKCYRNIEAAFDYLVKVMKIPPSRIVLYGRSLGSGPSCYLAKKTAENGESVAGIILHSPFLSIYRIVLDVKSSFVGDMFQSYTRAKSIKCPVFIIHGENDQVVPFWHSVELLKRFQPQYRAQPFFVKGMGHNNIEVKKRTEYIEKVTDFFDRCVLTGAVPEEDRYMPDVNWNSKKSLINRTWVKHGREIVQYAMRPTNEKTTTSQNTEARQEASLLNSTQLTRRYKSHNQNARNQNQAQDDIEHKEGTIGISIEMIRSRTNEILSKLITNDNHRESNDTDDTDGAGSTKFIETMESWDTEGSDIKNCSFDSKIVLRVENERAGTFSDSKSMSFKENLRLRVQTHDLHSAGKSIQIPLDNVTNQAEGAQYSDRSNRRLRDKYS